MIILGSFGRILQVEWIDRPSEFLVAKQVKFKNMSKKERMQLQAEVRILRSFHSDLIVKYKEKWVTNVSIHEQDMLTIIMEYCGGGDLSKLIKQGEKIAEDVIWKIFSQIVMALHECHRHPGGAILHRDLKPSNIFLSEDLNIKLGDFGLSK